MSAAHCRNRSGLSGFRWTQSYCRLVTPACHAVSAHLTGIELQLPHPLKVQFTSKWKFSHYLFTLMSFQTCMLLFKWNTKGEFLNLNTTIVHCGYVCQAPKSDKRTPKKHYKSAKRFICYILSLLKLYNGLVWCKKWHLNLWETIWEGRFDVWTSIEEVAPWSTQGRWLA